MIPRCRSATAILFFLFICVNPISAEEVNGKGFLNYSSASRINSAGERIAHWADRFIGTPYDTDPLGRYVRKNTIVADESADCMYHTFRSVELALSSTPEEAVERALDLRFVSRGKLENGVVTNYDNRFEYGEDMIDSGKWGKEITSELGRSERIVGSRGKDFVMILPKADALNSLNRMKSGDIIFFVKAPEKRVVGEIIGHIGIITVKDGIPYLVHAGGKKDGTNSKGGGRVVSLRFSEYIEKTGFIGIRVTRFPDYGRN